MKCDRRVRGGKITRSREGGVAEGGEWTESRPKRSRTRTKKSMEPRFILKTQAVVEEGCEIWALASPAVREKIEKEAIFALVALV